MSMPQADVRQDENQDWIWCYICHRCYTRDEAAAHDGERMCAYFPECDGTLWRDGWAWSHVLTRFRRIEAGLPDVPERGIRYLDALFQRIRER